MNASIAAALQELRSTDWFRAHLKDMIAARPSIRSYNPTDAACVEQWKADSMRREGYDLALMQLGYKHTDLKGDK